MAFTMSFPRVRNFYTVDYTLGLSVLTADQVLLCVDQRLQNQRLCP